MCDFAYANHLHEKVRQSQVEERRIATNDLHPVNASCVYHVDTITFSGWTRYEENELIVVLTPTVVFRKDADCSVGARCMAT